MEEILELTEEELLEIESQFYENGVDELQNDISEICEFENTEVSK